MTRWPSSCTSQQLVLVRAITSRIYALVRAGCTVMTRSRNRHTWVRCGAGREHAEVQGPRLHSTAHSIWCEPTTTVIGLVLCALPRRCGAGFHLTSFTKEHVCPRASASVHWRMGLLPVAALRAWRATRAISTLTPPRANYTRGEGVGRCSWSSQPVPRPARCVVASTVPRPAKPCDLSRRD